MTFLRLELSELNSEIEIKKGILSDEAIPNIYRDSLHVPERTHHNDVEVKYFIVFENEEDHDVPEVNPQDATGKDVLENPLTDMLIHAEVLLPQGG